MHAEEDMRLSNLKLERRLDKHTYIEPQELRSGHVGINKWGDPLA